MAALGDGDGGRGAIGRTACELVAMVRPCQGNPAPPQEIWDRVVGGDARLPGNWDATPGGALDAVRTGDWALAAYLAAQCFKDAGDRGAQTLAAPDERCSRSLWLELVTPIVLEVPRGQERLCVRFGDTKEWVPTDQIEDAAVSSRSEVFVRGRGRGSLAMGPDGSAEHLRAGTALDLSQFQWRRPRLRRLVLEDEESLQLQRLLLHPTGGAEDRKPGFLIGRQAPTTPVLGLCYHVVAYPFAGDVTKALLRPVARSWAPSQREAAERAVRLLGETLISQCAKAGQWLLVETLLKAGVPCPDLALEFQDVCGACPAVRRQWRRDLSGAAGRSGAPSLLALAAWSSGPCGGATESSSSALHKVIQALKGRKSPLDFRAAGPLIVTAARSERWDVVRLLLEQPEDVDVCAGALLDSKASIRLPGPLRELAEARRASEESTPAPPRTLAEYFRRRLAGEMVGLPQGFKLADDTLKDGSGKQVMNLPLRLVDTSAPTSSLEVAFAALSDEQVAAQVREAAVKPECGVLPIDLNGQAAVLAESDLLSGSTYLAVACPGGYLEQGAAGELRFSVPRNCIPTPHIMRNVPVRVSVVSPCCHAPMRGADVLAGRIHLGSTGDDGKLALELPPGRHVLTSPACPLTEQAVDVKAGGSDPLQVELMADGEVYLFLQENTPDSDFLMLCCNREHIPLEARPFHGHASLPGRREPGQQRAPAPARGGFAPAARVLPAPTKCFESLRDLAPEVAEADGREFVPKNNHKWFESFKKECLLASMFAGSVAPQSIGNLIGPPPAGPSTETLAPAPPAGGLRQLGDLPTWADHSRTSAPAHLLSGRRRPPWRPTSAPSSPTRRPSVSACGTIAGGRYFTLGPTPKPWASPSRGQH